MLGPSKQSLVSSRRLRPNYNILQVHPRLLWTRITEIWNFPWPEQTLQSLFDLFSIMWNFPFSRISSECDVDACSRWWRYEPLNCSTSVLRNHRWLTGFSTLPWIWLFILYTRKELDQRNFHASREKLTPAIFVCCRKPRFCPFHVVIKSHFA